MSIRPGHSRRAVIAATAGLAAAHVASAKSKKGKKKPPPPLAVAIAWPIRSMFTADEAEVTFEFSFSYLPTSFQGGNSVFPVRVPITTIGGQAQALFRAAIQEGVAEMLRSRDIDVPLNRIGVTVF
jgi:hypothetical protein